MLSLRFLYTMPPTATKTNANNTPIAIPTFFPALIPPPDEWFESELALLLTSLATVSSAGADIGVGVGDDPGATGGDGGDGLGD